MQQTKKFKMADAISPYLAVSCELTLVQAMAFCRQAYVDPVLCHHMASICHNELTNSQCVYSPRPLFHITSSYMVCARLTLTWFPISRFTINLRPFKIWVLAEATLPEARSCLNKAWGVKTRSSQYTWLFFSVKYPFSSVLTVVFKLDLVSIVVFWFRFHRSLSLRV